MLLIRVLLFAFGVYVVLTTIASATRTFVLPRSAPDLLTRRTFRTMRFLFDLRVNRMTEYLDKDRVLALFAPVTLLILPVVWLTTVLLGYMCMFWALGVPSWYDAFKLSGSSLLTLGFSAVEDVPTTILAFTEAAIGLVLVALLIAYLPTMYTSFARREAVVTMLEVRAGSPPSAVEMLLRANRIKGLDYLNDLWPVLELWFVDIEESHTSLAALSFFRSPQPERSWITSAGAVLDAAALLSSTLDVPRSPEAELSIRAGYIALRRVADFFGIAYNAKPTPTDTISVTRHEFDEAYETLASQGVPLKPDRDQAWRDFVGWRVNYDTVLIALAALVVAPPAPWSSDRSLRLRPPRAPFFSKGKKAGQ